MKEVIFPTIQSTVGICKQITLLILHQLTSTQVPFLKLTYASE